MTVTPRHLDEDDCLDLVHGLHDDATEAALLDHARACGDCAARLLRTAGDLERFRARGPRARPERAGLAAWWRRSALAGGLAVAALAAVWFLRTGPPTGPDAADLVWLPDASGLLITRDAATSGDVAALEEGLRAYARRDADAARRSLERAEASGAAELLRRAYLANAAARAGDFAAATAVLEATALDSLPEPWRSESRWLLAVAWGKTGRTDEARALLQELARGGSEVAERARARLAAGAR